MKPEDMEFVRSQMNHNRPDIQRLLSLLIESEAMREKAEFEAEHFWDNSSVTDQCFGCGEEMCKDPRAKYSDADWIANQKKEWGI